VSLTGSGKTTATRVVIADDAVLFREGLSRIIAESGFEVIGQVGDATALIELVRASPPDLAIVDLRMPPGYSSEGIDAAIEIRRVVPQVGLLLLSQHVEAHHALRLMNEFDSGVGYLLKDRVTDLTAFRLDLQRVATGEVVIDPELVRRLVGRTRNDDPLRALSDREREVLTLMAEGKSNLALSESLHLSVKTVEAHVRSIFVKLGLELDDRQHRRVRAVLTFLRS
jgi:DNA-binding NarL/FixJ family response regulator